MAAARKLSDSRDSASRAAGFWTPCTPPSAPQASDALANTAASQ